MMRYKDYIGIVEYDDVAKIFHGEIINTRDVITFQGKSVSEIEKAFQDSIDDYLNWCKEDDVNPEKPFNGKIALRIEPKLHREIASLSKQRKISINKFITKAIVEKVRARVKSSYEVKPKIRNHSKAKPKIKNNLKIK